MMKIAFVYDRVNKWGGAERVLLALHEIWPDAPLYTAVYDPKGAPWASAFDVRPSFLEYLPLAKSNHELYAWITQMAFETFSFDEYDVVISVTSAEAKAVITKPGTLHICYCLTPTRYLWSAYDTYQETSPAFIKQIHSYLTPKLRKWDLVAAARPDYYIAISHHVKRRIEKYYGREVDNVIYPPVDISHFELGRLREDYYLLVSRLVGYKRVDIVVDAFNKLGWPLVVIGDGWARKALEKRAANNIRFVSHYLTDHELARYYQNCRAFIFAGDEDFGIVAAEAQACGKPVIGFRQSGISEIVLPGKTGELFSQHCAEALMKVLQTTEMKRYNAWECRENAMRFNKGRFKQEMKETVTRLYQNTL